MEEKKKILQILTRLKAIINLIKKKQIANSPYILTYLNDEVDIDNIFGLELEFCRPHGSVSCRHMTKVLNSLSEEPLTKPSDILSFAKKTLSSALFPILYKNVHTDGSNDEVSLLPFNLTYASRPILFEILDLICDYYRNLRYTTGPMTSVHISIPIDSIDIETLKKISWIYYNCNGLIFELSNRVSIGESLVDFRGLIGDIYGLLPEEDVKDRFFSSKNSLLKFLRSPDSVEHLSSLNIGIDLSNHRIEFRWFSNTLHVPDILCYIELIQCLRDIPASNPESLYTSDLINYIIAGQNEYPNLYRKLCTIYPQISLSYA